MRNLLIQYDSNYFSVHQNRITLWLHRFELSLYFIAFFFTMYFIYTKSSSKIEVKIGIIGTLAIAFLVVIFKKIGSLLGKGFSLSRMKDGININNKINTSKIDIGAIDIKEMISTHSTRGYYDISIMVNNKKIPIALGVSERDKIVILEGLNFFLSSEVGSIR